MTILSWQVKSVDNFSETYNAYLNKMKNRLYGLLCEREKGGEWEKFLDTIVIGILGQKEELSSINYWSLLGKVQSLRFLSYEYFRGTIFECMNLMGKL